MRNLKKVLSLVLCVAMMLSVMVMSTGAAFPDQDKIQNAEAVDMATALGIIDGYEDGTFRPAENIERGEAVKMISAMLNGGRDAVQETTESSYTDVLGSDDAWANKYIEYCTAEGIVSGVGGDCFAPASDVTGTQLAKMLLVSLGYDADKEAYQGTTMWSVNVNTDAVTAGLYAGIESVDMNAALTRDNAAQMIWNALQAETVRYSLAGQAVKTGDTLLETAFGDDYAVDTGVMAQVYYNKDTKEYTYSIVDVNVDRTNWANVIGGSNFIDGADIYTTTSDYSDLFAMNVTVLHNGDKALLVRVNEGSVVVEGVWGDIGGANANGNTFTVNGQKYRLDNVVGDMATIAVPYNGFDDLGNNVRARDQYSFRAIDLDGGGDVDLFVYYPYVVLKVDNVKTNEFVTSELAADDAKLVAANAHRAVVQDRYMIWDLAGTIEFDDVQVNGTLARYGYAMAVPATYTTQGEDYYAPLTIQSGVVKSLNTGDRMITMNGTQYDGNLLSAWDRDILGREISLNNTYSYVEVNGYLFILDGAGMVPDYDQYVVVTKTANYDAGADATWETDLLTTSGNTIRVDVSSVDMERAFIGGPVVGGMYTYEINDDGYYELTAVTNGNKQHNTSVFDLQQVYQHGATLNDAFAWYWGPVYINHGKTGMYGTNSAGGWFKDNTSSATYNIEDDAVIFVYNMNADPDNGGVEYSVVKGSDLENLDAADINWAFTGASEKEAGIKTVDLGYVCVGETPDEITMYAALGEDAIRAVNDETGKFYISVDVIGANGEVITLETAESVKQDKALFEKLYEELNDDANAGNIFELILDKDGKLIGIKNIYDADTNSAEITGIYNGIITLDNGDTVFVTDSTVFIPTGGMTGGYDDLTVGDTITYKVNNNTDKELVFVEYYK